jgi:C4-dicarboxylate-specific signal transduction histidine kinase
MAAEANGRRMIDLALNAIELLDRNLYERTCDVRWWATDSAVVTALAERNDETAKIASSRLGVILKAYTVYLDIWICDLNGNVVASGRPDRYRVANASIADRSWFSRAKTLPDGDSYAVGEVSTDRALAGSQVATYAASIRRNGDSNAPPLGVIAIHFDWQPQSQAIVSGVRLTDDERARTHVMLVDSTGLILASSNGQGVLHDRLPMSLNGRRSGCDIDGRNRLVAFHHTPGYETYEGLGWYGVIVQEQEQTP